MGVLGYPETGLGAGCGKEEGCFCIGKGREWERLQPASNLHTCIVVLFCKGVRRRRGRGGTKREQAGEVRTPASSDLPTRLASLLCAIPHLTAISPQEKWKPDTPKGEKMKRRAAHRCTCA